MSSPSPPHSLTSSIQGCLAKSPGSECEGLSPRTGPGPPSRVGGGVSFRTGPNSLEIRGCVLSSEMPENFKKKMGGGAGKGGWW